MQWFSLRAKKKYTIRLNHCTYLGKQAGSESIFFVFDEPTTGLHFDDIKKLLTALQSLVENGHTVVVIEHNVEIIKSADWVVDLGPEGGKRGGNLVYQGDNVRSRLPENS